MVLVENLKIQANPRILVGKKSKKLQKDGLIPAVIYGKNKENLLVSINFFEFNKIFAESGETSLIEVNLENQKIPCIIRQIQFTPVKNNIIHADLFAVDLKEKVEADIPLTFIGQAPAVVDLEGTLIEVKNEIHVEALPADLVSEIEVSIEKLKTFDDTLHVKDVIAPKGVEILNDPEETIATVEPPRSEEELAALEEKPAETEAEALEKVESETKEGTAEAPAAEEKPAETEEKPK